MKALSIRQPWAWLIVHGFKDVENRTWPTTVRGEVLIHAGQRLDMGAIYRIHREFPDVQLPESYDLGGIVGRATIVDCTMVLRSRWFEGPWGFVLRDPVALPFRRCRGRLGFFEVIDLMEALKASLGKGASA